MWSSGTARGLSSTRSWVRTSLEFTVLLFVALGHSIFMACSYQCGLRPSNVFVALGPSGFRPQIFQWPTATIWTLGRNGSFICGPGSHKKLFVNATILSVARGHTIVMELKLYLFVHQWLQATLYNVLIYFFLPSEFNWLCGLVVQRADRQARGREFEPRRSHCFIVSGPREFIFCGFLPLVWP